MMERANINRTLGWLVFGLMFAIQLGSAQFVEISAEIELTTWQEDHPEGAASATPALFSVVCVTGRKGWRIEHDRIKSADLKWHFDGTNVYDSIRVTQPMSEERKERIARTTKFALAPVEVARSNVTIHIHPSRDGHPLGDLAVNIPWLAFCSGPYLKSEGRIIPLPVALLRHTRDRFAYSDKTETFADDFGLPRRVDLFTSKSLLESSEDNFDRENFLGDRYAAYKKRLLASFEEGVLTFHYAVSESTNFLGWNFPTKFEFFQKGRRYEQNGNWFFRGRGRVKFVRPSAEPQNIFEPTLQQTIVDARFCSEANQVGAIIYTSTNAFAAPTNDAALQEKFRKYHPPRTSDDYKLRRARFEN